MANRRILWVAPLGILMILVPGAVLACAVCWVGAENAATDPFYIRPQSTGWSGVDRQARIRGYFSSGEPQALWRLRQSIALLLREG